MNRRDAALEQGETTMASEDNGAFIRNIAEVPWREFPNHFGGALSKPLVMPETAGSRHLDYRISMYQPMGHVATHKHQVQEQIYDVLEGEGLMEIAGRNQVVRKHDFIFLPPGVEHAISNTGLVDLVFLVITSPVTDDGKAVCPRLQPRGPETCWLPKLTMSSSLARAPVA